MKKLFQKMVLAILLCIYSPWSGQAGETTKFYISLDTNPKHFRNLIVADFVRRLQNTTGNELDIQVFHSGQLFKGRDELKGLAWGNIQMAVPGVLSLSRFDPNLNLFSLPAFYGLPYSVMRELANGRTIKRLNSRLEQKLPIKVVGSYLELGYLDTFSVAAPIQSAHGYTGLKIRVPGGGADIARYKLLGANPVAIPFADVPLALSQGAVDGISSSYETVKSGILWDTGLLYAFEDRAAYYQYIPIVSNIFWQNAPRHIRSAIKRAWSEAMIRGRQFAADQQKKAKAEFIRQGGQVIAPDQCELESRRRQMLASTPIIAKDLHMTPKLVQYALQEVDEVLARMPFFCPPGLDYKGGNE